MGDATKIEWCDHTASPWHGCSKVHEGCANCYAEAMSKRNSATLGVWGDDGTRVKSKSFINNLRKWNRLGQKIGVPQRVFPSICDPFEDRQELVPWRQEMFAAIDSLPWVRLLLLTKRPENVWRMWEPTEQKPLPDRPVGLHEKPHPQFRPNVWLGTSISTQEHADKQIPELLKCRELAPVLFLSIEPMLGPVDISHWLKRSRNFHMAIDVAGALRNKSFSGYKDPETGRDLSRGEVELRLKQHLSRGEKRIPMDKECRGFNPQTGCPGHKNPKIDWVIVGGESGPNARPMHPDWVRSVRDQCQAAGVPLFFKQWGEWGCVHSPPVMDGDIWMRESGEYERVGKHPETWSGELDAGPGGEFLRPVGKKAAGRMLDGREWSEFPAGATQ